MGRSAVAETVAGRGYGVGGLVDNLAHALEPGAGMGKPTTTGTGAAAATGAGGLREAETELNFTI